VPREFQIFAPVTERQFVLRGRARVEPRQSIEQSGLPQRAFHGVVTLGPLGMLAAHQVFAADRVRRERRRFVHSHSSPVPPEVHVQARAEPEALRLADLG
jgi:hypothetical protein